MPMPTADLLTCLGNVCKQAKTMYNRYKSEKFNADGDVVCLIYRLMKETRCMRDPKFKTAPKLRRIDESELNLAELINHSDGATDPHCSLLLHQRTVYDDIEAQPSSPKLPQSVSLCS